jgi:hypothetical protein
MNARLLDTVPTIEIWQRARHDYFDGLV